ncbi:MAG: acetolactate synthase large subunit, partial [Clostridia bacterium]|nr:acetolactate synthase large subunit [Clostridia bacterium]
ITVIIINNGVLGMVRQWQKMFYSCRYSHTTLERQTDFAAVARAFGAAGFCATNLEELQTILDHSAPKDGPCVIDCRIDMDENVLPMIPPGCSVREMILK